MESKQKKKAKRGKLRLLRGTVALCEAGVEGKKTGKKNKKKKEIKKKKGCNSGQLISQSAAAVST